MRSRPHVIGLDLGGTDLKAARLSPAGEVLDFTRVPSRAGESPEVLMVTLLEAAARWREGACAVGAGIPGVIHPASGALVDETPHLALPRGFPVREQLELALELPAVVDNDANCAALGEHRLGAARGAQVALVVTLGTGVGCGVIVDGRVLRGAWGGAGEIGHMGQRSSGPRCECGVEGCAEPLAAAAWLPRRAREAGLGERDAAGVFADAAAGDERARALVGEMADALGAQLACAVQVMNPEIVVIGGGVAQAGEALLAPLRERIARYAQPSHVRGLRIVPAMLGNRAGAIGAGLLAWEAVAGARSALSES
jgi:glucokinase